MSKFTVNSTQIPNAFIDEAMASLTDKALRIYLVVVRKTTGWHKASDAISIAQIKEITGYRDERTIRTATRQLVDFGLVTAKQVNGKPTVYSPVQGADFDIAEKGENQHDPLHDMHPPHEMHPLHDVQGDPLHDVQGDPLHDMHPTKEKKEKKESNIRKVPKENAANSKTQNQPFTEFTSQLPKEVVDELRAYRKLKSKPVTPRALNGIAKDLLACQLATGKSLDELLEIMQKKSWLTIRPDWLIEKPRFTPPQKQNGINQLTIDEVNAW